MDAQAQQAAYEALAVQQMLKSEQLRVVTEVRANYYRLYVINKQIEVNNSNQELLENLIETANSRIEVGAGSQGDVLLGTLQLAKLEEELIQLKMQRQSTLAVINKALTRPVDTEVVTPHEIQLSYPGWNHESLQQLAYQYQPEIAMSTLQEKATRWGIEVASLKRRPDFSINANYFLIDDNRPASNVVGIGEDAWSLGAAVTIPLWDRKYDAIEQEATRKHYAAHFKIDEVRLKYEAMLLDFTAKAKAAEQTAELYKATILPQARQTLDADLQSYAQGTVEFDRVIQDYRNLLTLELGYHRSVGEIGIALALINQAVGRDVRSTQPPEIPPVDLNSVQ
ncbi:MAG: TolC family protein [Planctomycetaceae bacterium]